MKREARGYAGLFLMGLGLLTFHGCSASGGSGVVFSDAKITQTFPANGALQVAENILIEAQFSEDLLPASISPASFLVLRKGSQVAGQVIYDVTNRKITFFSSQPLDSNTVHKVSLTSAMKDKQGKALVPYEWSFVTADTSVPYIIQNIPQNNVHFVPLDTFIQATFSKKMNPETINQTSVNLNGNGENIPGNIQYHEDEKSVIFTPFSPLQDFTEYTVTLHKEIQDLFGNPLAEDYSWKFKTISLTDPATVLYTIPADQAENIDIFDVPNNHPIFIEAHFSMSANSETVNDSTFLVKDDFGIQLTGNVEYFESETDHFARFTPTGSSSVLGLGRTYTVTLTGIQDMYENLIQGNVGNDYVWSFKTRSGLGYSALCENSTLDAQNPQIALDSLTNFLHAIWQQNTAGNPNHAIYVNSFTVSPDPTAAIQLSSSIGDAINPKIVSGINGGVYAVWEERVNGEANYSIVFSQNLGYGWETPIVLDNDTTEAKNASISVGPNGSPVVVWEQSPSGFTPPRTSIFLTQKSGTWSIPVAVEIPLSFQAPPAMPGSTFNWGAKQPQVMVDSTNNVIVCFTQFATVYLHNGPMSGSYYMGPNIPTGPMLLNIIYPYGGYPSTYYPTSLWVWDLSDTLVVTESAWGQLGQPAQQIWQILDDLGTTTLGSGQNALYPAFPTNVTNFSLAVSGGHAAVLYQQKSALAANNESIFFSGRPAGSTWWQTSPTTVGFANFGPEITNIKPKTAIDSLGNVYGVWEESVPNLTGISNLAFKAISAGTPIVYLETDGAAAIPFPHNPKIAVAPNDKVHVLFDETPLAYPFLPRMKFRFLDTNGWSPITTIDDPSAISSINGQMIFSSNSEAHFIFQQKLIPNTAYSILVNNFHD